MGMFDHVRCEYPLPDGFDPGSDLFQTKDTDAQHLDTYVIKSDGTLWHEQYDYRDIPERERGRSWLAPIVRRVNARLEPVAFHGALRFYTIPPDGGWREYVALYDHGRLLQLELVEDDPTPRAEGRG